MNLLAVAARGREVKGGGAHDGTPRCGCVSECECVYVYVCVYMCLHVILCVRVRMRVHMRVRVRVHGALYYYSNMCSKNISFIRLLTT